MSEGRPRLPGVGPPDTIYVGLSILATLLRVLPLIVLGVMWFHLSRKIGKLSTEVRQHPKSSLNPS